MPDVTTSRIWSWASSASALLASALLPGCAWHQLPPRTLVGKEGASGIIVRGAGEAMGIQTLSILPGPESTEVPTPKASCNAASVHVQIWAAVHDAQWSERTCSAAARAAAASLEGVGASGMRVRYRITLVNDGGGSWIHRSAARDGVASLAFWFPAQHPISDVELARVVRTTAHEFHHAGLAWGGSPRRVWADEPAAYAVGACTQLAVLGRLRQEWLPPAHDWQEAPLQDQSVMRSSRAGADLHVRLLPFFEGREEILLDSLAGQAVLAWCRGARVPR